jgi:hypothetical protein
LGLQGTLDTFELPDVLRMLAATGKTGRLHIEGDRGRGAVSLCQGSLTDATVEADQAEDWPPVDVFFELLRFEHGSFRFTPAPHPDVAEPTIGDLEVVLGRATALLLEWRELAEVVPSPNHRVALAPHLPDGSVTLGARRWKLLATIADQPTIGEVAERLSLGEIDVARALCDLVELGVATIRPPAGLRVPAVAPAEPAVPPAAADPTATAVPAPAPPAAPPPPEPLRPEPHRPEPRRPEPLRTGEHVLPPLPARPRTGTNGGATETAGTGSKGNGDGRAATDPGHEPPAAHQPRHGAA